ncbi:MAG: hypothetical protein EOO16_15745 [Chitinophagaceae bacterium]|nr:MAG: hypothetical protein EOO16_15745 [Chitinophagaceae bacterium]
MKIPLLSLLLLAAAAPLAAQKTELRVALNSGYSWYTGSGASKASFINYSTQTASGYTNNVYGGRGALGYGLSLDLQRVTRYGLLLGFRAGPEVLRSRQQIIGVWVYDGFSNLQVPASGSTRFSQTFLALSPFVGWRAAAGPVSLDASAGIEFAFALSASERGSVEGADGRRYSVTHSHGFNDQHDGRYRFQLGANYRRYGVYAGLSTGQVNLRGGLRGNTTRAYSRYARFGLTWRL